MVRFLPPLSLLFLGLLATYFNLFVRWDRLIYDYCMVLLARPQATDIVIVAVDEKSLKRFGRWPWPRSLHSQLIDTLSASGARAIGFDILIAEQDSTDKESDLSLVRAVTRSKCVYMPIFGARDFNSEQIQLVAPLPELITASSGLGHVDVELDSDGILRRAYLKAGLGKAEWPAMALAVLQHGSDYATKKLPGRRNSKLNEAHSGHWVRDYEVLIPFGGRAGHFKHISYSDLFDNAFNPDLVRDKYVFVGATASGLGDVMPTPVSGGDAPMAGVEVIANLFDALASEATVTPTSTWFRLCWTGILILLPLTIYPQLSQRGCQIMLLLSLIATVSVSILLLFHFHLWFPPLSVLTVLVLSYPVWAWRRMEALVIRLQREKETALVTLDSIADGVIVTDSGGWIRYLNQSAQNITGYSKNNATGKHLRDILPIVDIDMGLDRTSILEDCQRRAQIIRLEEDAVFRDKHGEDHIVEISAGPILDRYEACLGTVLGVTDVTEKRQAQRDGSIAGPMHPDGSAQPITPGQSGCSSSQTD